MSTLFSTLDSQTAELQAQKDRINQAMREKFYDAEFRREVAQEIKEGIYKGFASENIVDLFTETINLDLDGRFRIEKVEGIKAFWHARGGYIQESDVRKEIIEIAPDTIGFRFRQSQDRLRTNFAETAQTLVRLGSQRLTSEINARVFRTYQAAIGSGHPSYTGVANVSLNNVLDALASVKDNAEGDGGVPVIVGRTLAINELIKAVTSNANFTGYTPETNEQLLSSGQFGRLWGSPIRELRNFRDGDGNSLVPANELWVILPTSGKTAYFGSGEALEANDLDDWYWNYVFRMDLNTVLLNEDQVARIVISSIPA